MCVKCAAEWLAGLGESTILPTEATHACGVCGCRTMYSSGMRGMWCCQGQHVSGMVPLYDLATPLALSVLLIIGSDIIQKALTQLSGCLLVPIAFSFG